MADEYSALVQKPDSGETALQEFIEKNPWLLGLDYVKARPRKPLPRGAMDFILERYDGLQDFLELKSPQDPDRPKLNRSVTPVEWDSVCRHPRSVDL